MPTRSERDVFERMRDSYDLIPELGLPNIKSKYWEELLSKGRQDYAGKGNFIQQEELWQNFRNNVISKGLDNANVPEEAVSKVQEKWRRLYARLSGEIPDAYRRYLEESPIGKPMTLSVDGIRVTQSSLEYTYMLTHLAPYLEKVDVAIDIGGGYGGMARILKLARPELRLILLDLPEVNAIQTYFLSRSFPDARILCLRDVVGATDLDARELDADFLILPGQLIEKIRAGSLEVAINTRSMMEMDLETVSFYLSHVQDKIVPGGVFYGVNRYEKKTRLKDYPFDERWYVSYSEPWPTFIDQNPHHELILVRTAFPVVAGVRQHLSGLPPFEGRLDRLRAAWSRLGRGRG